MAGFLAGLFLVGHTFGGARLPNVQLIRPERLAFAASKRHWAENTAEPRVHNVPPCSATPVFWDCGLADFRSWGGYMIDHGSAVHPPNNAPWWQTPVSPEKSANSGEPRPTKKGAQRLGVHPYSNTRHPPAGSYRKTPRPGALPERAQGKLAALNCRSTSCLNIRAPKALL